ncbi:MAG: glycosyl hydrolase [Blastocatellia bacterium]|nr:glycosyl hydrolase [Blastocatellia bacterium]
MHHKALLMLKLSFFLTTFFLILVPQTQAQNKIDSNMIGGLEARSIGPAVMSGRVMAIDGVAKEPNTIYIGAAGGGIWKTTNGGATFKPIFDKHTQSIGAIAIDQSRPNIIWVGTGESCTRNSVSVGTGIYKSSDGGENWQLMGLEKSERISKIIVDPKTPDTVYVAVVGQLWNSSEDRGLYKTTDGGKKWEKVLYVDENTGCSDIAIDPQEPNRLYAGMWQFRRQPWSFSSGGAGSGLYRSLDAGKTWSKVTKGMPEGILGRIALAVSPARANVIYANIEAKKTGFYRSDDLGESWTLMNAVDFNVTARPFYFSHVFADPKDYKKVFKLGVGLSTTRDGGASFSGGFGGGGFHPDLHALWIDPNNPARIFLGTDGGVYLSNDQGVNWHHMRNLPLSQFYHVSYDKEIPYNVYGGLQDNNCWFGPSNSSGAITNSDWKATVGGDGFNSFVDTLDKNIIYSQAQGGAIQRFDRTTRELKAIKPFPKDGEAKYRFNWNAAFTASQKNPSVIYVGAQFLFRSTDKGDSWQTISPDLTTNDPKKQLQVESGGLSPDNSSAENHCTIFTVKDSLLDENVIWVGTDDGNLQLTRDGGKTWNNVVSNISGLPANTWCSSVEPSNKDLSTAYATFMGYQTGDMKTYVYKTTDFGKTWQSLASSSINGYARVIREDLVNPNLLFLGTEFGLFISIDAGKEWAQFTGKFPSVAVYDLAIQPRESDLIIATHGRGIYILDDIAPLRQLSNEILSKTAHIFETRPSQIKFPTLDNGGFGNQDEFFGSTLADAAYITYYLKERHVFGDFKVEIYNSEGKLMTSLPGTKRRGINRVLWYPRLKPPKVAASENILAGALVGPSAPEGTYTVKIVKGEESFSGSIKLVGDARLPHSAEDRKLQQESVMNLYRLQERLAFVTALITSTRDKAQEKAKGLKDTDPLSKSLTQFAKELDLLHENLVVTKLDSIYGIKGEEKLRERIVELFGTISGYGGRPSKSQLERAQSLINQVEKANKDFEAITSKDLDSLNNKLTTKKLEPIKLLTQEEFDKANSNN